MKKILLTISLIAMTGAFLILYAQFASNCPDNCQEQLKNCRRACAQISFKKSAYNTCNEKCEDLWRDCRLRCK
jgi:hypothetical protein